MPDENTNPNPGRRLVRRYRSTNPLPTNRPQRTRDVLVVISDDEGEVVIDSDRVAPSQHSTHFNADTDHISFFTNPLFNAQEPDESAETESSESLDFGEFGEFAVEDVTDQSFLTETLQQEQNIEGNFGLETNLVESPGDIETAFFNPFESATPSPIEPTLPPTIPSTRGTRVTEGISYDTYERIADARNVRTANIPTTTYDASGVPTTTYERIAPGVPTIRVARTPPAPPPRQHAAETSSGSQGLDVHAVLKQVEKSNIFQDKYFQYIILTLGETALLNKFQNLLQDIDLFVQNYHQELQTSINLCKDTNFWSRHFSGQQHVTVSKLTSALYNDYNYEIGALGVTQHWIGKTIMMMSGSRSSIFSKTLYDHIVVDEVLDSYDAFWINVKQCVVLGVIVTEVINPKSEIKDELIMLLEQLPLSCVLLRDLMDHPDPMVRVQACKSLSPINFNERCTFDSLYRAGGDIDCRVRLEYCKVVAEFLCPIDSSYFTKDEPDTEFDKMLRDKVVEFRNNDFKEGLVAKLVEIWKNDPYENVSRESYVTLRYINAI